MTTTVDRQIENFLNTRSGPDGCDANGPGADMEPTCTVQTTNNDGSQWVKDHTGTHYLVKNDGSQTKVDADMGFPVGADLIRQIIGINNRGESTTPLSLPIVDPIATELTNINWDAFTEVSNAHPRAVLKFLKSLGFCLVKQPLGGNRVWVVESVGRWISSGDCKKGFGPTLPFTPEGIAAAAPGLAATTASTASTTTGTTVPSDIPAAVATLKTKWGIFLCFLQRLVNVTNSTHSSWIDGNPRRSGPVSATVLFGAQHRGLRPVAQSDRRAGSLYPHQPLRMSGGGNTLGLKDALLADVGGIRHQLQMGGSREIQLSIKGDSIYGIHGIPFSYDNVELRADQSGGGKTQVGGQMVYPVGFTVVKTEASNQYKELYESVKNRLQNAGFTITNDTDFVNKLETYDKLHKEVEKTMNALAIIVKNINQHGFNDNSPYLNLNTVETLANHFNQNLRGVVASQHTLLNGIECMITSANDGVSKRSIP